MRGDGREGDETLVDDGVEDAGMPDLKVRRPQEIFPRFFPAPNSSKVSLYYAGPRALGLYAPARPNIPPPNTTLHQIHPIGGVRLVYDPAHRINQDEGVEQVGEGLRALDAVVSGSGNDQLLDPTMCPKQDDRLT